MPNCDKKTISFLLTTRCNLNCTYCYGSRNAEYRTLGWNFAKRVMDDYIGAGTLGHIRFFADGEPTTEMDLLKKIFKYAKKTNNEIIAEIQTNGVFNTKTADWLGKNLDYIYISADLLPNDNDKYRLTPEGKPSSPYIEKSLKYLCDMPERKAKVGIRATITKYNINRQKEGIDYYYKNYGIDVFWVDPIFPPIANTDNTMYEEIDMKEFAYTFVDAHNYAWAHEPFIFYESNLTTNFDGKTDKACRACIPLPHLTVDGYISACEMATHGENAGKMDAMIYAKYDVDKDLIIYDEKKLTTIKKRTLSNMPTECRDCVAANNCAGYCLGESLNETGSLFAVKTRVCWALRYIYKEIGHLYKEKFGSRGFPYKHP